MTRGNNGIYRQYMKRLLDLLLASLLLIALCPLMLLVALVVRLTLGRPILYIDQRGGLRGVPFGCWKFRTMTDALDATGQRLPDEQRRTPCGDWLRATSLDELPQLWNVLRGQMSLVGPRPLTIDYSDRYTPEQQRRHDVRPGITGWAQVNGRTSIPWEQKFEFDAWYVERVSFWLDAKIVLLTLWQHVPFHSARRQELPTESEFIGTESQQA